MDEPMIMKSLSSKAMIPSEEVINGLGKKYEEAFGHDAGLHRIIQNFLGLLPADARVLDCGCGTGKPVSSTIAESGRQVYGIDLSPVMVELSRKQVPTGTFEETSMLQWNAPANSFTGVVANLSLFFTRKELTSMSLKWFQWLQPGGLLLIGVFAAEDCPTTTPDMYDSDGQCASGIPRTFMGHEEWITLFTEPGWNGLLEKAGFEIVHTETDVFVSPAAAVSDPEPHYYVIARKPSEANGRS